MGLSSEKKLRHLEDELKALKATYSVYGGAMLSYLSVSPTYDAGGSVLTAKIKFTPDIKPIGPLLVSSIRCDLSGNNFLSSYATVAVQDGSGSVIIQVPIVGGTFSISITTTSPGTFTRLA